MGIVSFLFEKFTPVRKPHTVKESIYDLTFTSLSGKKVNLSDYAGENLLLVNTASRCGYTYQYEELQQLHEQYGNKVRIIGFPANDFLWQEPGSNEAIATFCEANYGVTFPMASKITVKGKSKHPIYAWLEAMTGRTPTWNFCKYLVTNKGETVQFFSPGVRPLDKVITDSLA